MEGIIEAYERVMSVIEPRAVLPAEDEHACIVFVPVPEIVPHEKTDSWTNLAVSPLFFCLCLCHPSHWGL